MNKTLAALVLSALLCWAPEAFCSPRVDTSSVSQFPTEQAAQKNCPGDTVVWLNTYSGIWHYKGAKYWMNTKYGAFVCEDEARKKGMRASRDGS